MAGQLSVVKGAGKLGGVTDYGESGSIHQSVSNGGKNWFKSSRWKLCSAWGGLSALSVTRVLGFCCCLVQSRANREMTAMTPGE